MAKRPNFELRHGRRVGKLHVFVRQYARKTRPNLDPNDRHYDRDIEKVVRRMQPEELDRLLRDDEPSC